MIKEALTKLLKRPIDKSTVYNFIDYMLNTGFIEQNPDSHITINDNILPDNMTKYFLKSEEVESLVKELYAKEYEFNKSKGKIPLSLTLDYYKQVENVESQRIGTDSTGTQKE